MRLIYSKGVVKDIVFLAFIFLLSFYCIVYKLPPPDIDDLFYKVAGVNLILDRGFSAPQLIGWALSYGMDKAFVAYPPIYPLLYGAWFYIFNISLSSSLGLSYLLCGLIVFFQILLFNNLIGKDKPIYIYALIFFAWTLSVKSIDRPDLLLEFFAVLLFLKILKNIRTDLSFQRFFSILLLMWLCLSTSPALGLFLLLYLFFTLLSLVGLNFQKMRTFGTCLVLAGALCILTWWLVFREDPSLFYHQCYIRVPGAFTQSLASRARDFFRGFRIGFDHFGLAILSILATSTVATIFLDKSKRRFFTWQALGFFTVVLLLIIFSPVRYTYRRFFWQFFIIIGGSAFVNIITFSKLQYLRKSLIFFLYISLFLSCIPFFPIIALPLSWNVQDSYDYNKNIILETIPRNSKICAPPYFWYALVENHEIFDAYFVGNNPPECDYILFQTRPGGSDPMIPMHWGYYKQIISDKYIKQASTMIDEPTRVFGIRVLKSRWSYRFVLYRKNR